MELRPMKHLRAIANTVSRAALAAAGWLLCCELARAAFPPPQAKASPNDTSAAYAVPYGIVILVIFVGLAVVLRPSRRRNRAEARGLPKRERRSAGSR